MPGRASIGHRSEDERMSVVKLVFARVRQIFRVDTFGEQRVASARPVKLDASDGTVDVGGTGGSR
jgi:hypothetical protein